MWIFQTYEQKVRKKKLQFGNPLIWKRDKTKENVFVSNKWEFPIGMSTLLFFADVF